MFSYRETTHEFGRKTESVTARKFIVRIWLLKSCLERMGKNNGCLGFPRGFFKDARNSMSCNTMQACGGLEGLSVPEKWTVRT